MRQLGAFWRLMRFDKPAGTMLLWAPTACALWLANRGLPSLKLFLCFFLGTIIMRALGCVINDIADRNVDKHVKRTCLRPLTSGEISLQSAFILLISLLLLAFLIVVQLPLSCFYYALFALLITFVYPFCKRFFYAPQLILSIAFSLGIPMAYAASFVKPDLPMYLLLILNFAWILAYDTEYAMVDREDDLKIGVNSTAVLFKNHDRLVIFLLQILITCLWLILALFLELALPFYVFWLIGVVIFIYQQRLLSLKQPTAYLLAFRSNSWYGLLMWIGIVCQFIAQP